MKYKVTERTSSRSENIIASSFEEAINIAKMNYNMPLFGFYTVEPIINEDDQFNQKYGFSIN